MPKSTYHSIRHFSYSIIFLCCNDSRDNQICLGDKIIVMFSAKYGTSQVAWQDLHCELPRDRVQLESVSVENISWKKWGNISDFVTIFIPIVKFWHMLMKFNNFSKTGFSLLNGCFPKFNSWYFALFQYIWQNTFEDGKTACQCESG